MPWAELDDLTSGEIFFGVFKYPGPHPGQEPMAFSKLVFHLILLALFSVVVIYTLYSTGYFCFVTQQVDDLAARLPNEPAQILAELKAQLLDSQDSTCRTLQNMKSSEFPTLSSSFAEIPTLTKETLAAVPASIPFYKTKLFIGSVVSFAVLVLVGMAFLVYKYYSAVPVAIIDLIATDQDQELGGAHDENFTEKAQPVSRFKVLIIASIAFVVTYGLVAISRMYALRPVHKSVTLPSELNQATHMETESPPTLAKTELPPSNAVEQLQDEFTLFTRTVKLYRDAYVNVVGERFRDNVLTIWNGSSALFISLDTEAALQNTGVSVINPALLSGPYIHMSKLPSNLSNEALYLIQRDFTHLVEAFHSALTRYSPMINSSLVNDQ